MQIKPMQIKTSQTGERPDFFKESTWQKGTVEAKIEKVTSAPVDHLASGQWKAAFPKELVSKYKDTLGGLPTKSYDPNGFLAEIGLPKTMAGGRTNVEMLKAFKLNDSYDPDPRYLPLPSWLAPPVQWLMLGLNKISPSATAWVDQKATDLIVTGMEEPDMIDTPKSEWFGKMEDIDKGEKIDIRPGSRYLGIGRKSVPQFAWSEGVHIGSPKGKDADFGDFGTYDIAKHLGFTEEQAMRIAKSNNAVDTNETHYRDPHDPSKPRVTEAGSGGEAGDFHWHFNRAAKGEEDTRITAAKVHLERAVELTKDGYFNAAERELGIGLHGLQDVFAHSQITPLNHSLLGEFPDFVKYHPVGMYEAAVATEGYLRKFASAMNLSAANKDVAGTGQAGAGVARAGIQAPAAQSASAATISQKAQLAAQLVSGEGPQATTDKITRMVTAFPAGLVDFLKKNEISIVVGGPGFDPTTLGFGADLDGDGAITAGKSIDVNQDGVLQGFEGEGNTANGVAWSAKMGGYNHANRTIFVAHEAAIDDKMTLDVLQHEVRHAIDSCFREDPALKSQWESYVGRIYEDDRRSGDLGFAQTDAREHVADH